MNKFFKRLALLLAVLMIVSMMPVQLFADNSVAGEGQSNGTGESYLTISGIKGFEGRQFASFAEAYTAIKPVLEGLCAGDALGQGVADAEAFDALFTNCDEKGNATLTYTISGNVVYNETDYANLLTMGRRASHYGNDRHLINFKFVGATGKEADTLIVNSNITLPYEWWGEKTVTSISFENLTITGSAPSGLYPSQPYFEGINFKVDNCNLKGIKIYNCSNVKGTYTITNSTLDGTGAPAKAYAIHLQGNETEPLTINISGNTISGYDRGINIDQKTANATISGNKISIKEVGRSCIQLSRLANVAIADNTLELTGGNAITLHELLLGMPTVPEITVEGNTITGNGYLIYDDAVANSKAFTSENLKLTIGTNTVASTVDTTQGVKGSVEYDLSETVDTVVKDALTPTYVAKVNGVGYATLAEAIAAATPDANGVITYKISGKAEISGADQWISFVKNAEGVTAVKFVGMTADAEISITSSGSILGVKDVDVDVSFENLTLSHPNGIWVNDLGHATNYFACMVRNSGHTVTYTNCTFPNGACNNMYGNTVFNGCKFTNATSGKYNLWNYGGNTEIKNSTFTGVRGIKTYNEGTLAVAPTVKIENTKFDGLTEKAAIVTSKATDITLDNVSATKCTKGFFQKAIEGSSDAQEIVVVPVGSNISGKFNVNGTIGVASAEEFNISAGTFTSEVSSDYLADGFELKKNIDGTYGVKVASVAKIGTVEYASLDDAIKAAKDGDVIVVSAGEYKLNGSLTYTGKAFTIKAAVGVKVSFDMSAAVALHGAKITFEGVTFDYKTNGNYIGIQHADTLVYNSCTINGQVFLYATNETFNGCTFNQTSAGAYNVWTYGAKNVEFNKCVFNCVGKSVLLYNEGANTGTDLTVTDTTFKASAPVEGKAAIEIDTSLMGGQSKITVDKATADKTTGFATGSNSGNSLWNDKANEKASDNENVTVVVANETVYEPAIIDLDTFIKKLVASGYNFDGTLKNGGKLTVKWSPVSGCYDARTGHTCTVNGLTATGNTPKRVNSGLTQFQLFEGLNTAVIIKNVKFVYEPAAFTVCENSGWKGSFTAEQAPAGQLYFMTTGNVTVESCDFEKVVFTTFNTTGTSIVKDCKFKDVYNSYAIKDIRGENVSVTGTTIENCGGGIMVSSTGAVSNVTITGNTFKNVDAAGTAAADKVGTRAILQIASSGDYKSTAFVFSGNTATSCGPVIRQLNTTVAPVGSSLKYLTEGTNTASRLYTSDSNVTYVAEVTFTDGTTKKYSDIAEALEAANAGDTVTLLADINTPEKTYEITKSLTIDLNGKTVTGSGYDGVFEVTGKNIEVFLNATNGGKVIAVENSGSDGKYAMAVWMCGAGSTLTINGGEFIQNITSTNDKQMDMIYASAGTIIINSGSFTSGTPKWTLNIKDSAYKNSTANIIVNGGTFTDYDPRNAENEGKGTSLVANGVGIDKNADGTFTAKSGMAAQIVDADGNSVAAYATLADAIAAAKSGATVTLLDNIDISTTGLTISAERTITLDLNGHTLKVANTDAGNIKVCGKLTLKDSTDTAKNGTGTGKIYTETPYIYGTQDKVMIATMSGGEFTMESGLIDAASFTTDNANVGHFAVSVQNDNGNATVTINGGHIKAGWYAIAGNGQNSSFEGNIIVNGGILESVADYAIYHPHAGTTTINGGVVFGAAGGVSINRGKLVVNGGTITSKGTGTTGNWGDGTGNQAAAAINVNAKYETTTVEIKGGTITAEKDAILLTNGRDGSIAISGGTFSSAVPEEYCADRYIPTQNEDGTYGVKEATKGSKNYPYTLEELSKMTRDDYITAQEALGGTMYVEIGDYIYDKNGVLGNGKRDDTTGQTEDRSVLNGYNSNGYLRENNDGANGKNIIFVGGSITSRVKGYASIDNIGTSLLLAVPAYTNVTFEGVTFENVMSFNYQLYTSPWSQLGELKFSGCTFNGLIVGAIAAQTLTFNGCEFKNYTNTTEANNSNPTWIRPAYGNWSKGDNEGQGSDFKSLTTINFTNNTVTSTRPVKFEYISQWDITSTVTATGNYFDITAQSGDTPIKNVGLYLGAHTDANEFHLVAADNTKSKNTAALYTIPSGKTSLPVDSTVKNTAGESIELTDALKWKATDAEKDKIVLKTVIAVASIGERRFATLEEAVAAVAKNGEEVTIKLLSNITAGGIDVAAGQNIVFDFDGHTYTLDGSMVGSTGTKTNGFRFLKGSTVVLKNGTLANGNGSPAKAMINSYATLKLVDFSVDARTTAVAETGSAYGYAALYISNGVTTVTGNGNYTTSDDNFVILIANVGDYTDGASLVFDENYTGTVSGKVSTGNKQNATVEIKNGKFDLKSIDVENTNTTVTISGGKFKNIEIAGKYLDNKAFDTEADADGYYAVMAHPIESFGVTVGEGLSLRLYVRDEYRNGKLLIKYVKPNGRDGETIEKELKINSVIENVNGTATIRYCARIFNITPQMADVVIKVQYVDETGVAIGSEKEVSILKYCQNYVKEDSPESVKIFISKLLEYCATAMDYRIVTNADEVYSGNTWQKRAEMLRKEKVSICGEANKEYKFENLGTYTNIGETFTTRGMEYDSVIKIFFAIDASKYNSNYKYYLNGNEISPIHYTKDDKDQYRFYFTIAPYEYHNSIRITIKNGEDDIGEYACSLDIILESFSKKSGNAELDALARLSVAAYEYCRSLADYPTSKDFNQ